MAELLVAPDKLIQVDDEDFDQLAGYIWKTIENVSGRIGRRLPNGRIIGLAATLLGKRPSAGARILFRDKNPRNFSKANVHWDDNCLFCKQPMHGLTKSCDTCKGDVSINQRFRTARLALRFRQPYYYYGRMD